MNQLLDFQRKVGAIKKDGKNPHFKSTYATLTQILSEVKPLLSECGLILIQPIENNAVVSRIVSDKGELIGESALPLPEGLNAQQVGSCITYYRRYTLASLLALEIDDDDANLASQPKTAPADDNRPWLNKDTDKYKDAVMYLQGGGKIDSIEKKYKLSKQVRELLLTESI